MQWNQTRKKLTKQRSLLITICLFLFACAAGGMQKPAAGSYVGSVKGVYATTHYKVIDQTLHLSFQNTTVTTMRNVAVVVRQQLVNSGFEEVQTSGGTLRVRDSFNFTVPLSLYGTGAVELEYYFMPAEMPVSVSPGISAPRNQILEDKIILNIANQVK